MTLHKTMTAYEAGKDCALNGANTENCNFKWFATPELLAEWERGKTEALHKTKAGGLEG